MLWRSEARCLRALPDALARAAAGDRDWLWTQPMTAWRASMC